MFIMGGSGSLLVALAHSTSSG